MIILYARNAIGEGVAYAFLPLVLLGWILILKNTGWKGIIAFSFGLGMVINSHIITAFYTCLFIAVGLALSILYRKVNGKIVRNFVYSIVLTLLVSIFTIANLLIVLLNNKLATAGKGFGTSQLSDVINASLNNYIGDKVGFWNIGLISLILLFVLFAKAICIKQNDNWKMYIYFAMGTFLFTLSWLESIDNYFWKTILGNIQFSSRLLSFVMLFLEAALVLYLDSYSSKYNLKKIEILICSCTFCLSVLGVKGFHYVKNDDPIRYYLTSTNYESTIEKPNSGWSDYILVDSEKQPLIKMNDPKLKDITRVTYDRA